MKAKELKKLLANVDDNAEVRIHTRSALPWRKHFGIYKTSRIETVDHQGKMHSSFMLVGR